MSDCMIDIETTSTKPNAGILSIGAIKFDRISTTIDSLPSLDTFYIRITQSSLRKYNFQILPLSSLRQYQK